MNVSVSKDDISCSLAYMNKSDMQSLFNQCVEISNLVSIKKTLPVGSIQMDISIRAVDGFIELNIVNAKAVGFGFFGVIRKVAGDTILNMSKPIKQFTIWKHTDGNLRLKVDGIYFTKASCAGAVNLECTV